METPWLACEAADSSPNTMSKMFITKTPGLCWWADLQLLRKAIRCLRRANLKYNINMDSGWPMIPLIVFILQKQFFPTKKRAKNMGSIPNSWMPIHLRQSEDPSGITNRWVLTKHDEVLGSLSNFNQDWTSKMWEPLSHQLVSGRNPLWFSWGWLNFD
jgi:hypothetical protein